MKPALIIALLLALSLALVAKPKGNPTATSRAIDGEQVYKTNCTRCHNTPPSLKQRQTRAVVNHMRVRANLVAEQADAVLQYLSETARK